MGASVANVKEEARSLERFLRKEGFAVRCEVEFTETKSFVMKGDGLGGMPKRKNESEEHEVKRQILFVTPDQPKASSHGGDTKPSSRRAKKRKRVNERLAESVKKGEALKKELQTLKEEMSLLQDELSAASPNPSGNASATTLQAATSKQSAATSSVNAKAGNQSDQDENSSESDSDESPAGAKEVAESFATAIANALKKPTEHTTNQQSIAKHYARREAKPTLRKAEVAWQEITTFKKKADRAKLSLEDGWSCFQDVADNIVQRGSANAENCNATTLTGRLVQWAHKVLPKEVNVSGISDLSTLCNSQYRTIRWINPGETRYIQEHHNSNKHLGRAYEGLRTSPTKMQGAWGEDKTF